MVEGKIVPREDEMDGRRIQPDHQPQCVPQPSIRLVQVPRPYRLGQLALQVF